MCKNNKHFNLIFIFILRQHNTTDTVNVVQPCSGRQFLFEYLMSVSQNTIRSQQISRHISFHSLKQQKKKKQAGRQQAYSCKSVADRKGS